MNSSLDLRDFLEELKNNIEKMDEKNENSKELMSNLEKLGAFSQEYPIEFGGENKSSIESFNIISQIARVSPGTALAFVVHYMAVDVLLKYGSDYLKDKYLKNMVLGKSIASYSISETTAGSDTSNMKATAKKVDGGYILNGQKFFVTNGEISDLHFVACKTDIESGARGISMFLVPKDTKGVKISYYGKKMGFRTSDTTNLIFEDCFIPDEFLIGEENKGYKIALDGLTTGRLGMVAIGIGISESAIKDSIEYAKKREVANKPIAKLYAIQEKISKMTILLEASRFYYERLCNLRDKKIDYSIESSMAKVFVAEATEKITYEALQIFGGHGYMEYNNVERYERDARLLSIGVGSSEVLNMVIGNSVLNNFIDLKLDF